MRKSVKIFLIIASSLVGMGILFLSLSFVMGGTEMIFKSRGNSDYKVLTATFDEVSVLEISETSNNVRILKSDDDKVKVTYAMSENFGYYLKQIDDTLIIEYDDFREWYEFFGLFSLKKQDLIVELPEETLEKMTVTSVSGSITAKDILSKETQLKTTSGSVEAGGTVGKLSVKCVSGSVQLNSNTAAESVSVSTTSGSLRLSGDFGGDLSASTTSGDINFSGAFATDADISVASGDIEAQALYLKSAKIKTLSGDVELKDVTCSNDMAIDTTSGDIELDLVDADNYDLSTTSGDIEARLLSEKVYNVKSTSGRIDTPQVTTTVNGVFSAETTSGDIEVKLVNR